MKRATKNNRVDRYRNHNQTKTKIFQPNYFTFSSYINAWSLKKGLRLLGYKLYTKDNGALMVSYTQPLPKKGDILFFTEENNLLAYQKHATEYYFYPQNQYDWDNKFIFFEKLQRMGELPVPSFSHNDCAVKFPIYLKAKRSWFQHRNMPRGFLCQDASEISKKLLFMEKNGFDPDLFFLQKFIENGTQNTFSVCGFFDYKQEQRNFIIILRKVLGTHKRFATSIIVETVKDPEKLMDRTCTILSCFSYIGPFELEFIFDQASNRYYVLELNPRFWMQHGIFIDFFDNYLIKCYLNLDTQADRQCVCNSRYKKIYWVNFDFFYLLKMPLAYVKAIMIVLWYCFTGKAKACFYPNFSTCIRYFITKVSRFL